MIREEIWNVVKRSGIRENQIARNISIIYSYYGLGEIDRPTLESVGRKHGSISRERVRQIVENSFAEHVRDEDIPSFRIIANLITSKQIWIIGELNKGIEEIAGERIHIYGLVNALKSLHYIDESFTFYSSTFDGNEAVSDISERSIFAKSDDYLSIAEITRRFLSLPGQTGLYRFDEACDTIKEEEYDLNLIQRLLLNNQNCHIVEDETSFWFLIEQRDNIIKNTLSKIANVSDTIRLDILRDVIFAVINRRSHTCSIPSKYIIERYLIEAPYTDFVDDYLHFEVEKRDLNEFDNEIVSFFIRNNTDVSDYRTMREDIALNRKLLGRSPFSRAYYQQLYSSPFIHKEGDTRGQFDLVYVGRYSVGKTDDDLTEIEDECIIPGELSGKVVEGAKKIITVNRYERDPRGRKECLEHFIKKDGRIKCQICGFEFGEYYGDEFRDIIEVHHLTPISEIGDEYILDPQKDLLPVCPNCHTVLHSKHFKSVETIKNRLINRNSNDVNR